MRKSTISILFASVCLFFLSCGNQKMNKELTAEDIYKQSSDKIAMVLCYQNGIPLSQGSGFFIDKNTLVTNYHVVEGADRLELKVGGDSIIYKDAQVIKASPKYDLAIIHTQHDFPFFQIEKNTKEEIGSKLYSIGNPRGLENSISEGMLSGRRESNGIQYLQITAPISPGNSGGPILDKHGNVIGVATFTFSNGQNLNFAMPIHYIKKCVDINSINKDSSSHTIERPDSTAITVVTYSKRDDDDFQQISFKNNTNHTIKSIDGVLIFRQNIVKYDYVNYEYKNWQSSIGDIFNYQVFSVNVEIAPHLTKLVTLKVEPDMIPHRYCKDFCSGCGNTDCIHYHYEFRLLSYEIED